MLCHQKSHKAGVVSITAETRMVCHALDGSELLLCVGIWDPCLEKTPHLTPHLCLLHKLSTTLYIFMV